MTTPTPAHAPSLPLAFQEAITAIVRLRGDRQPVTDATAFRAHMRQLLERADQDARAAGFDPRDVQLATFAVVALLDESMLNTRQPALAAEWSLRPLQEELFGGHMAGEWVFQHIEQLLTRPDSPALGDLLEIHHLVLLLGFRGRYGSSDPAALHAFASRLADRLARLRGARGELSPAWRPPDDAVVGYDPWVRRLVVGLAASVVLVVALWGAATLSLR